MESRKSIDNKEPLMLLLANNYERNFGDRALGLNSTAKVGKFSYMRNGAAMLYVPSGREGTLVVTVEPRDESGYDVMIEEIRDRLSKGELGNNVNIESNGKLITLTSKLSGEDKPILKTIVRYGSEFWLNAKFNNVEL